jgi:hypothetical protein
MSNQMINMTPHAVTIVDNEGNVVKTIPPSGQLIRLKAATMRMENRYNIYFPEIPFSRTVFSSPEGLQEYDVKKFYIVSQLVKSALPDRDDLLVPAEVVRDSEGNIIGCKSLGM